MLVFQINLKNPFLKWKPFLKDRNYSHVYWGTPEVAIYEWLYDCYFVAPGQETNPGDRLNPTFSKLATSYHQGVGVKYIFYKGFYILSIARFSKFVFPV